MTEQSKYSKERKLITNITVPLVALNQNDSKRHNGPKDHGMAAHPQKTKYMITGTRQKLSRCEESALSLCLDGRQLEQTQEERLLGLDIDATLMIPRFL